MPRSGLQEKLPADALAFYYALGPGRSYRVVAEHFGVHQSTVARHARDGDWQRKVVEYNRKAEQAVSDLIVKDTLKVAQDHIRAFRLVRARCLQKIRHGKFETMMDAVRALDIAARNERLAMGEPTERTAMSIEDVTKRELERWAKREDGEEEEATDADYEVVE